MELLEGETLAHRLAKGQLPVAEVVLLGAQFADALDRAHRAGVVHRTSVGLTLDTYSHLLPGVQEQAVEQSDAAMKAAMEGGWK